MDTFYVTEQWILVPGHPEYEVSSGGVVRSVTRTITTSHGRSWVRKGRTLTSRLNRDGYPVVRPTTEGRTVTRRTATLVALAFLGPRPTGLLLRHLDDNRSTSALVNLAYGTDADNTQDRVRNGRDAHARLTHCPHDHEYTEENTYRTKRGHRHCRQCARDRMREGRSTCRSS